MRNSLFTYLCFLLLLSCTTDRDKTSLFTEISLEVGINFINELHPTEAFNPYTFRSFYNGGGVAIGDVDNNGYQDIYFTGNQAPNKLYLNHGKWNFQDVTEAAGIACEGVWTTGTTFVDINQDGWLDLYVCKSGEPGGSNRANSLFINNQDGTFTDKAHEYGLAEEGLSVQAAFFDFDRDGDLDCYLLTNSIRSVGSGADLKPNTRDIPDNQNGGNKLFRNDNGKFINVSKEAGIYSSSIGFGLGVTVGDFNDDKWPDIFVSNDFFEKDYIYINNQEGSFLEQGDEYFNSMSLGSMGADIGDINSDGLIDIVVTEMLPRSLERKKTKTMYESWNKQVLSVENGYHYQYPRNMLHLGVESGGFTDIGRYSEIANSEWSWGALVFDMDNDGSDEIFISNGIYKDLLDRDFLSYTANDFNIRKLIANGDSAILRLLDHIPSSPVSNMALKTNKVYEFKDYAKEWGLESPSFSNGSAYADLDNDGDLDLVVNNVNQHSFVYRNNTNTANNHLSIRLVDQSNVSGIGAEVRITGEGFNGSHQNFPVKGFQSSSSTVIHFGLGNTRVVDTLFVYWPSGKVSLLKNIDANQVVTIYEKDAVNDKPVIEKKAASNPFFAKGSSITFQHQESDFIDFNRNALLPEMYSNLGARVAKADLNGDRIDDFYFGNAKNSLGALMLSKANGYEVDSLFLADDRIAEDIDAIFFDCDNDNDLDLYVASGGVEVSKSSNALLDRIYINDGNGYFQKDPARIPASFRVSSSFVKPFDYDQDGDMDVLIGERQHPLRYGVGGALHLLNNKGDGFFERDKIHTFDDVKTSYLVTDAQWTDLNNDGLVDIVAVGEWSPIMVFINHGNSFVYSSEILGLSKTLGWWNTIEVEDLNNNGLMDLVIGNKVKNTFFKEGTTLHTFDFDGNGFIDNILSVLVDGELYPVHDKDELINHFPALKKSAIYYQDYASQTTEELFTKELIDKALTSTIDITESSVFMNIGSGFVRESLPPKAQLGPVYAVEVVDFNHDGWKDLIVGGNQHNVKPQYGRYDGINALLLFSSEGRFDQDNSMFTTIEGQVRDIALFQGTDRQEILFFMNDDYVKTRSFK